MDHINKYKKTSVEGRLKEYKTENDVYWKKQGEEMAIALFKDAAERVPAYKNFLKKHGIKATKIKTIDDFKQVPVTDKSNYINVYKLNELCWDGKLANSYLMSASSGSTGVPNFWPRSTEQTMQGASISEKIYKEFFQADKKSTLYIVAFAMGTWIAGTYMMMSTEWVAQKGYPITVVTPGTNKEEIFRLVRMGKEYYDQIVLIGYPPFIKDVIDTGISQGIDWKQINIKFMFSGEAITERWRSHIQDRAGLDNILTDTVNIYGSADIGLVAHETPLTTYIRRLAYENGEITKDIFGAERIPSVNQFDPSLRYFEKVGEELIVSARSGIPLIRYNTKDVGDILYYEDLKSKLNKYEIDIDKAFSNQNMSNLLWKIPIVYLFGRGKFTTTIYVANIYPENVRLVLEHPLIESEVTGKFMIHTEEKEDHTPQLVLHVELAEGKLFMDKNYKKIIKDLFISEVPLLNSEYKYVLDNFGSKVHPKVILHEYGDPQYFPRGVIKKNA